MTSSLQSWSIFVPCFNEEETLKLVVDKIAKVLDKIASGYEIVIVDDGSTDNSKAVIQELVKTKKNVVAIFHELNYGIGSVQRLAYTTAKFENVTVISADGQFDPEELLAVSQVSPKTWISFYRQQLPSYTLSRKFLSGVNKLMNQLLYGLNLKDVNWAMIFKTDNLRSLNLQMTSTLIKSEACIKLCILGGKVIEIPSTYHPRKAGAPKGASFKIIRQAALEVCCLYFAIQRFKKKANLN